jgi:signal transduction histidine kinase
MRPHGGKTAVRQRWSLERRLGLLIVALLAAAMAIFGFAAYREVRASAVSRATDRLERVARELAASSGRSGQPRLALLQGLGRNLAVVAAMPDAAGPTSPDRPRAFPVREAPLAGEAAAGLLSALQRVELPGDSTLLGWELWGADGVRRFRSTLSTPRDSAALATLRATVLAAGEPRRSPFYGAGGGVRFWTAIPVVASGRTIGVIAEHRRIGNSSAAEQTIRELVGDEVRVLFTSAGSSEWVSLRGVPVDAPFADSIPDGDARLVRAADGTAHYAVLAPIPGAPWRILLLQRQALVLERPRAFLRTLLVVGALLLLGGMVAAWLTGRHVARPLRRVTDAAAALAGGDYSQRVPVSGASEVAGLAATFNAMASSLGDAHAVLAQQNDELQRANATKEEFLAMMSHELRTPLNAIGGYAELLQLGVRGPVTEAQAEDLARIRRNKDHLLSIIGDMLSVSRSDEDVPVELADLSVAGAFSHAVDAVAPLYDAKKVRLDAAQPPRDLYVRGDRERVQQVLLNLLTNALKFTDAGGQVVLASSATETEVRLSVRDTGIGIPAERIDEIFEPFVQVDSSLTRRAGGAGLGLAIANRLAKAMAGSVTVESTLGRGSTFTFTLPRAQPAATVAGAGQGAGSLPAA